MDPPYDQALDRVIATLGSVGITNVALASSSHEIGNGLARCDAVFIGGGNVYSLMHALRASGAHGSLQRFAESGRSVYGGSAGALILGRDINTAQHLDPNDVGLVETSGLDLANGYAVWCHYASDEDSLVSEYVRATSTPVLALPERGGAIRSGEEFKVLGPDPARVFRRWTSDTLEPYDPVPAIA
jgi:dipeptidase E